MNNSDKIVLIGSGNVAYNLCNALRQNNFDSITVFARNSSALAKMAETFDVKTLSQPAEIDRDTKVVIICTSDDSILEVAKLIPYKEIPVVHTSGGMSIDVLSNNSLQNYGVFYPLQSLSKNQLTSFKNVPLCIEASTDDLLNYLKKLGEMLSSKVVEVDSENRAYLHLSAVFANNFTNHLFRISHQIVKSRGLSFDLLRPLIERTSEKVMSMNPADAQTGPALRNDGQTIENHLKLLKDNRIKKLYSLITEDIINTTKSHE